MGVVPDIVPPLLQKYTGSSFDEVFVQEVIIFSDMEVGAESGVADQIFSHDNAADTGQGGAAVKQSE